MAILLPRQPNNMSEISEAKTEAYKLEQSVLDKRDAQIYQLKKLITELADALEEEFGSSIGDGHPSNLIRRAREATK